ncbi:hypothetical protein BDR26DRAFT_871563 [Obelidium mucronatum]|nr:hypothetical protein BDR26DRAFT_871563 [Obelidium mucronatum]
MLTLDINGTARASVESEELTLCLSPPGSQVVVLHPSTPTEILRVSTHNAPRKLKHDLNRLIRFRNEFSNLPVFYAADSNCLSVDRIPSGRVKESVYARWPVPSEFNNGTIPHGPTMNGGEKRRINSVDASVFVELSPHGQTVTVSYPVSVVPQAVGQRHLQKQRSLQQGTTFEKQFVQCIQNFSVLDLAECWKYPVELLRGQLSGDALLELAKNTTGSVSSVRYIAIPLPESNKDIALSSTINSAFHPTLHDDIPIKVLQTSSMLYRVIVKNTSLASRDIVLIIEATFLQDGAVLRSDDGFSFVTLYVNEGAPSSDECDQVNGDCSSGEIPSGLGMYLISSPPDIARNWETGVEYGIRGVVLEMTRLYHMMYRYLLENRRGESSNVVMALDDDLTPKPKPTGSLGFHYGKRREEVHSVRVDGVGVFKAYSDSSVFVQFDHAVSIRIDDCDFLCRKSQLTGLQKMECGADRVLAVVTNSRHEEYTVRVFSPIGVER